jgi:asparagine synthase (glutamine-hydrolysing)
VSGICGIAFQDQETTLDPMCLSPMVRRLDIVERGEGDTICLGSVGLGAQKFPGRLAGIAETTVYGVPIALAFHGSLYNLRDLRSSGALECDPLKVLLSLYVREGMMFVHQLRGEFAVAIWDGREHILSLATDRFRVHPLFYYHDQDKLIFASRMKGILACSLSLQPHINPEAVVDVVASSVIPTPKTIFQEVKKLPPGHILTYHNGAIRLTPYWEISFLQPDRASEAELARQLKAYLTEAISLRLGGDGISDRIGTFLSGGVDSSTVTGVLAQLSEHSVKAFSVGFGEPQFNEMSYAKIAARAFDAEHYEYFVTPQDTYNAIPVLLEAFDEPFANASAVPTYFCAKVAKEQGVNILYAGDGGDELFAGNERYATQRLFEYYAKIPVGLRDSFVQPVVFTLADTLGWSVLVKGKKYIQRASILYPDRLSSYGFFKVVAMTNLLEDDLLEAIGKDYDPYAPIAAYYYQAPARSELDRQLYIDLKLAISDNDLFKVTRMTEAARVTVHFPFLDHRLAEFAATIPASLKMQGQQLRSFFKKAYADLLPREIRTKKKHGFGLPIPIWLRTDKQLNELMHDLVLSPRSIQRGYFRRQAVEALVENHKTDETSFYGTVLWNLMVLELWHRCHVMPRIE